MRKPLSATACSGKLGEMVRDINRSMSQRYARHWARLAQRLHLPTSSHCTQLGSVTLQAQKHGQRYTVKTETLAMKSANQTNLRDLGGRGGVRLNRPSCRPPKLHAEPSPVIGPRV